jgi:DNA topoisomerase VI subunit A
MKVIIPASALIAIFVIVTMAPRHQSHASAYHDAHLILLITGAAVAAEALRRLVARVT